MICVTSLLTTIRFESTSAQLKITVGEPAYAGRVGRRIWAEALSFVAAEVTGRVIEEGVGLAFDVARDRLGASTQRSDLYIGSYFADPYTGWYLAWSSGYGWQGLNPATGYWQSITPPNYTIWRINDVYQNSNGYIYSVRTY